MKTIILAAIRCSLMFATAAAFSVAYPAKANLIENGGFETGDFTGWTVSGDAFVSGTYAGISPHSGNFQALVGGNLISEGFLAQTLATTPGQSYAISFWLALFSVENVHANSVTVTWGGVPIFSLFDQLSFGYTEYTFNVTATSASTALQFDFFDINL